MTDNETRAPEAASPSTTRWRALALFLLTLGGVVASFLFIHVLLFPVTACVAFGVVLRAPRQWLLRHMGPSLAASLLLVALAVAVMLPGFFVVRSLFGEVVTTVNYVRSGAADQDVHRLAAKHPKIGAQLQRAADQLTPDDAGKRIASKAAVWLGQGLQSFAAGLTELVLMLFFLFFLLRDQEQALKTLNALVPLGAQETHHFLQKLGDLTYAVFAGRFLIAGLQGLLAGLAYWLLGVPGPLLWGTVTAVCCLIPAFGAFIAWVPIALYLGLADSWTKALILTAWGGIVVSNVDNVLYPVLVGQRTNLHTIVIFVAIFGGVAVFGLSGFVLGPVLVAATMLLLEVWKDHLGTGGEGGLTTR